MEKIIVKFSRPLLFRESIDGKYYLAYGFVLGNDSSGMNVPPVSL